MKYVSTTILAAILISASFAQDAAKPKSAVPETIRSKMLIAYQLVLLRNADYNSLQQQLCDNTPQCKEARAKLNAALSAYNSSVPQAVKDSGLPEGYVFDINVEDGTVKGVPAPNAAKKVEEKPTK